MVFSHSLTSYCLSTGDAIPKPARLQPDSGRPAVPFLEIRRKTGHEHAIGKRSSGKRQFAATRLMRRILTPPGARGFGGRGSPNLF
jgi:hypothetical protein